MMFVREYAPSRRTNVGVCFVTGMAPNSEDQSKCACANSRLCIRTYINKYSFKIAHMMKQRTLSKDEAQKNT